MLIHSILYVYQIHNRYAWLCYVILIILYHPHLVSSMSHSASFMWGARPRFRSIPRSKRRWRSSATRPSCRCAPDTNGDTMVDAGDVHVERGPWHGVEKTAFILGGWELFKVGRLLLTFAIWPSLLTLPLVHSLYCLSFARAEDLLRWEGHQYLKIRHFLEPKKEKRWTSPITYVKRITI